MAKEGNALQFTTRVNLQRRKLFQSRKVEERLSQCLMLQIQLRFSNGNDSVKVTFCQCKKMPHLISTYCRNLNNKKCQITVVSN